jgi:hypothetical protein
MQVLQLGPDLDEAPETHQKRTTVGLGQNGADNLHF